MVVCKQLGILKGMQGSAFWWRLFSLIIVAIHELSVLGFIFYWAFNMSAFFKILTKQGAGVDHLTPAFALTILIVSCFYALALGFAFYRMAQGSDLIRAYLGLWAPFAVGISIFFGLGLFNSLFLMLLIGLLASYALLFGSATTQTGKRLANLQLSAEVKKALIWFPSFLYFSIGLFLIVSSSTLNYQVARAYTSGFIYILVGIFLVLVSRFIMHLYDKRNLAV